MPAGRQELQHLDQAGIDDDEQRRTPRRARIDQSKRQSEQHEGKCVFAVLPQVGVRPLGRRAERRVGDGGGEAPSQ